MVTKYSHRDTEAQRIYFTLVSHAPLRIRGLLFTVTKYSHRDTEAQRFTIFCLPYEATETLRYRGFISLLFPLRH